MSDVLIIGGDSAAAGRLREALERDGYGVAAASNLVAALPELYLSPRALRVILSGDSEGCLAEEALRLVAADPRRLGRHSYVVLERDHSMATREDRIDSALVPS
jgi:hypothetical protein